jgi:hypothetical protein
VSLRLFLLTTALFSLRFIRFENPIGGLVRAGMSMEFRLAADFFRGRMEFRDGKRFENPIGALVRTGASILVLLAVDFFRGRMEFRDGIRFENPIGALVRTGASILVLRCRRFGFGFANILLFIIT